MSVGGSRVKALELAGRGLTHMFRVYGLGIRV